MGSFQYSIAHLVTKYFFLNIDSTQPQVATPHSFEFNQQYVLYIYACIDIILSAHRMALWLC